MNHNIKLCGLGVAIALSSAAAPLLIGSAIDLFLLKNNQYIPAIGTACLFILMTPILRLSANIYLEKIAAKTRIDIKSKILKSLFTAKFSAKHQCGEIIDLVDGDVNSALYLYHGIYLDIAINVSLIILALSIIAGFHPVMLAAPILGIIVSVLTYVLTRKNCTRAYTNYVDENTKTISRIWKALTMPKNAFSLKLESERKKINKLALSSSFKVSILEALSGASYILGISTMLFLGAYTVNNGLMQIGAMFSSAMYIERVLGSTTALTSIYFSSTEALYRRRRIQKHIL